MRFYKPIRGAERTIKKFAWYPIVVDSTVYWLEWITIHQSYGLWGFKGWHSDWVIER